MADRCVKALHDNTKSCSCTVSSNENLQLTLKNIVLDVKVYLIT